MDIWILVIKFIKYFESDVSFNPDQLQYMTVTSLYKCPTFLNHHFGPGGGQQDSKFLLKCDYLYHFNVVI
jgi:hypothetical protein